MTKEEIFQDIVILLKEDASFCRSFQLENAELPKMNFQNMQEDEFIFAVNSYLCRFHSPGHLQFYRKNSGSDPGINVQRYGDRLYVTDALEESGFLIKDVIQRLDGFTIKEVGERYSEFFYDEPEDRQGIQWELFILPRFKNAEILREGRTIQIPIQKKVNRFQTQSCICKVQERYLYLKFENFFSDSPVKDLLRSYCQEIDRHENMIIDLRNNMGGTDLAVLPLLPYCLEECGEEIAGDEIEINYSERNVDLRIKELEGYLARAGEDAAKFYKDAINECRKKRGRGFCKERSSSCFIKGTHNPQRVFVLCDERTASSGETLPLIVKGRKKVTIVGRPTAGILKYSNCATQEYGNLALTYPTSVCYGMERCVPDVLVPWSPHCLEEDSEMKAVMELLNIEKN